MTPDQLKSQVYGLSLALMTAIGCIAYERIVKSCSYFTVGLLAAFAYIPFFLCALFFQSPIGDMQSVWKHKWWILVYILSGVTGPLWYLITKKSWEKQQLAWAKKCKTPYSFTSPDGTVYNDVRNLRAFAREHELSFGCLRALISGKIRQHKEWIKTGNALPSYQLVSPNGSISTGTFLKNLCMNACVNYKMVHKYCIKIGKPYQGWMAKQLA